MGLLVYFYEWVSQKKGVCSCAKARVSFAYSKPKQQACEEMSLKHKPVRDILFPEASDRKKRLADCEALGRKRLRSAGKGTSWLSEIVWLFGEGKESSLEVSLLFYSERLALKATDKWTLFCRVDLKWAWSRKSGVYWAREKMILFSDCFYFSTKQRDCRK